MKLLQKFDTTFFETQCSSINSLDEIVCDVPIM